jgi:hypothetical protein
MAKQTTAKKRPETKKTKAAARPALKTGREKVPPIRTTEWDLDRLKLIAQAELDRRQGEPSPRLFSVAERILRRTDDRGLDSVFSGLRLRPGEDRHAAAEKYLRTL